MGFKSWGGERTDVQTSVMVHPCVLQDIGPLGPLPKKLADAIIDKMSNHLWYTVQEFVVFALVSDLVTNDEKKSQKRQMVSGARCP